MRRLLSGNGEMTLEQLRIFEAVADREHVTRAAEALNLTQSAVSAAIAALEERHAVALFSRVGRRIELTHAGRLFLDEARAVLARTRAAELALSEIAGLERGTLTVYANQTIASYWFPPRLVSFRRIRASRSISSPATRPKWQGPFKTAPLTSASWKAASTPMTSFSRRSHATGWRSSSVPPTPGHRVGASKVLICSRPNGSCASEAQVRAPNSKTCSGFGAFPPTSSRSCSSCRRTRPCAWPSRLTPAQP